MLTINEVPFIAQVWVISYNLGYESAKYLLYKGYTTEIYINHLTSNVLKVNKITNTKHVSIKH